MRRRIIAAAAVACLGAALVFAPGERTAATWQDTEALHGTFTAASMASPTALQCTAGLLEPVVFTWTAPNGGAPRTGYRWRITGGITASGTAPATATSVTITGGLLALGSGAFELVAVGPGGWESPPVHGTVSFANVVLGLLSGCSVP